MWFRRSITLEQTLRDQHNQREREQRRNDRQIARLKRKCKAQLAILEGLRTWAYNYEMWWNDGDGEFYSLRRIYRRSGIYIHIRYFRDGRISLAHCTDSAFARSTMGFSERDPQLWRWLKTIKPEELVRAADDAAYMRGAGKGTLLK